MSRAPRCGPSVLVRLIGLLAVAGLLNGCAIGARVSGQHAQAADIQDQLVAMDGHTWVVGMHLVTVPREASVTGTPSVGDQVRVSGHRTESGELVMDHVQVLADAPPAPTPAEVPAQDSGAGATSAPPALDNTPTGEVSSPAPQARPPAPESGRAAVHGNQAENGDRGDKGSKPGKGHKGN